MVKLHKGFCSYLSALQCLCACQVEYVSRGYVCSTYASIETSSFELSVHYRDLEFPEIIKGLEPSAFQRNIYKDSTNGDFCVLHLYFGVAKEEGGEL